MVTLACCCLLQKFWKSDKWRDVIWDNPLYRDKVTVIWVDEVHLMSSWTDQFRPAYNRVVELRSFFIDTPLLLLSATCTTEVRNQVLQKLGLNERELHLECELPDRPNIYLQIIKEVGMDFLDKVGWYLDILKLNGTMTDKAIIYVSGVPQLSKLVVQVMGYLGNRAYTINDSERVFSLYHAGMQTPDLKRIIDTFSQPTSTTRLLICTIAFGIGINIPNIRYVIHWGACKELDDYWQEVGRAARDGISSRAIMYATNTSLQHVSTVMKEFVHHEACIRKYELDRLSVEAVFKEPNCNCVKV